MNHDDDRDQLIERMAALEARIQSIEKGMIAAGWGAPSGPARPALQPPGSPQPAAPPLARPGPASRPPQPPKPKVDLEKAAGVWLARIGVVLVFFAAAFFLKIAFEHIGDAGKVAVGVLVGLVLTAAAEIAERKKYHNLARSLTGGGLGVLYLSVFGAFAYYHLLDQTPAFVLMFLITAAGVTLSVRYDSQVIIIIALLGGFLTPVLLSTGVDAQVPLMSYMLMLDAGLIGVAYWRRWRAVGLLCYFATFVLFAGWFEQFYDPTKLPLTFLFATAFFAVFALHHTLYCLARKRAALWEDLVLITANAVIYFLAMWALLEDSDNDIFLGMFSLGLALVFFLQLRAAMSASPGDANLSRFLGGLVVGFATMAVPLQLDYEIVTLAWALEAAILTAYGLYAGNTFIRALGLGVLAVAVGHLAVDFEVYENRLYDKEYFELILGIFASYGSVMGAIGAMIAAHRKFQSRHPIQPVWFTALFLGEVILGLIFALVMNHYLFESDIYPYFLYRRKSQGEIINISLILSLYASGAILVGILYSFKWLRQFGLAILSLALLKVILYDMHGLPLSYRVASFLVLGGLLIGLSFLYQRFKDRLEGLAGFGPDGPAPPGPPAPEPGPEPGPISPPED